MKNEQISEKITTKFVINNPKIDAEHEFFVQMQDFEERVLAIVFSCFVVLIGSIVI